MLDWVFSDGGRQPFCTLLRWRSVRFLHLQLTCSFNYITNMSWFKLCFCFARLTGSSSASETYGNSHLAHTEDFDVKEVEVWRLLPQKPPPPKRNKYPGNLLIFIWLYTISRDSKTNWSFFFPVTQLWGFVYASKYEEMVSILRTEAPGICRW